VVKAFLNIWTWTIWVLEKAIEEVKGTQLNSLPTTQKIVDSGKEKQVNQPYLILKSVLTKFEISLDTDIVRSILLLPETTPRDQDDTDTSVQPSR